VNRRCQIQSIIVPSRILLAVPVRLHQQRVVVSSLAWCRPLRPPPSRENSSQGRTLQALVTLARRCGATSSMHSLSTRQMIISGPGALYPPLWKISRRSSNMVKKGPSSLSDRLRRLHHFSNWHVWRSGLSPAQRRRLHHPRSPQPPLCPGRSCPPRGWQPTA